VAVLGILEAAWVTTGFNSAQRYLLARALTEPFILLAAAALPATAYFRVPPNRVVELGTQVEVW